MITRRVLAVAAALTVAAALGLAAALVTGAAAHVGGTVAKGGSASFSDPAGDANGAADITAVAISDDPATGMVQFTMTANGELSIDPVSEPEVNVFIDTDRNPATGSPAGREFTGSPSGADYRLSFDRTTTGSGDGPEYWSGTSWLDLQESPTMSFSHSGDTFTWRLSKTDLGATSGFDFYLAAEIFVNHSTVGLDRAPDSGVWSYALSSVTPTTTTTTTAATTTKTVVKPLIGAPTTTPRNAIAGKHFTVVFPVTRSDTRERLTSGTMVCDPSVQGKVIPHAESFTNGTARLAFTIPRNAKGKLLMVKLTIKLGGKSTTRIASFHVG